MFFWQQEDSPVSCEYEDGLRGKQTSEKEKQTNKQNTVPGMGQQAPEQLQYLYF